MTTEPCGSWRVLHYIEGNEADLRWCNRIEGDCPFVGSDKSRATERRCATEPGTVLRVQWADSCIDDALADLESGPRPWSEQTIAIAKDALRACGAGESDRESVAT